MDIPYIRDGIKELKSWEWQYGQTPQFTYVVDESFDWGGVVSRRFLFLSFFFFLCLAVVLSLLFLLCRFLPHLFPVMLFSANDVHSRSLP
jgi:hypothetical protein